MLKTYEQKEAAYKARLFEKSEAKRLHVSLAAYRLLQTAKDRTKALGKPARKLRKPKPPLKRKPSYISYKFSEQQIHILLFAMYDARTKAEGLDIPGSPKRAVNLLIRRLQDARRDFKI